MQVLYTAEAVATGAGRAGEVRSSDGVIDEQLAIPKELGGPGGDATNPEQLFAAGYAACFNSALALVARRAKVDLGSSTVTARVGIGPDGGGFGLTVSLLVDLPGIDRTVAEDLAAQAHLVCPYSNATRGNIEVDLRVA
ncbi:MAG TPA: organic hydroperoxide resistance protein [Actinophytocola sp.]|uniref:organic hydroperoxide resistance protein n=1 Tax=Actinophytocola sp. TaxID=1872138 RepID=UPI002DDCCEEA|nr:organic hydroperoxide resistance protein [Actinophytocola sp.]HEV2781239.1 organic hydroperoxide resistance protein [Actinophytocola sp.]